MNRGFDDPNSVVWRLATWICFVVEHGCESLAANALANIGYFYMHSHIHCSGCGFNLPVSSPSVAVQHLTAQPECPVAHAHINSGFDNFTPLSTADVGTPYLLPNTTTNNQQVPNATPSNLVAPEPSASGLTDQPDDAFSSLQARIDSFDQYPVPNGFIHAKLGLYMASEYTLKCCHCGLDNFPPPCALDPKRGWQEALEMHSNQRPDCPFVGGDNQTSSG